MKHLKYIGVFLLAIFSFYFTDKVMIYMENKSPIMKEIVKKENNYLSSPVNAQIEGNYIIPGLNGKKVDKRKSYLQMEDFGSFNETFLVYNEKEPDITLNNNLDKIIIRGNTRKRSVSLILEEDSTVESLLIENKISYSILANLKSDLTLNREYINAEKKVDLTSDLNSLLNKNKKNSKICLTDYSNLHFCLEKKYYLVKPTLNTSENITYVLSNISSGSIILIKKNTNVVNFKLILKEIQKQDLSIIYLSKLISENN